MICKSTRHIEGGIAAWHAYILIVVHAIINIVWIVLCERLRGNGNIDSDFHFLQARHGAELLFTDPLQAFNKQVYKSNGLSGLRMAMPCRVVAYVLAYYNCGSVLNR